MAINDPNMGLGFDTKKAETFSRDVAILHNRIDRLNKNLEEIRKFIRNTNVATHKSHKIEVTSPITGFPLYLTIDDENGVTITDLLEFFKAAYRLRIQQAVLHIDGFISKYNEPEGEIAEDQREPSTNQYEPGSESETKEKENKLVDGPCDCMNFERHKTICGCLDIIDDRCFGGHRLNSVGEIVHLGKAHWNSECAFKELLRRRDDNGEKTTEILDKHHHALFPGG